MSGRRPRIDRVSAAAYRIPTDAPEADGTIAWIATTLVVADVTAGTTAIIAKVGAAVSSTMATFVSCSWR